MANTIRASKNTFNGGLVMDLAPDTTPNKVLTSALNATLVTFNGNELLLQNDMGNGRVETARLPEGYIPVGTCEFGDIIYIVSYNPLTNRSQIGCFPSPERNISSEEVGSAGQQLSSSDFLDGKIVNSQFVPNGELKASSVKKIIYNNKMNPGDKYIIYDNNNVILEEKHISDIGNTSHIYGTFPKLLKIHVVAIEDGGKINYLDSTIKWYNKILYNENVDYFMMSSIKQSGNPTTPDIDSYRDLLSSGYSVFQSKISGKLALLIELEKITGFSCTYNTYTSLKPAEVSVSGKIIDSEDSSGNINIMNKRCKVYWNINWNTDDNNVNPKYIVLTKSEWKSKQPGNSNTNKAGHYYLWRENNVKALADVDINISENIPSAYPNDNGYWFAEISRLYDLSSDSITYNSFIKSKSYEKKLEECFDGNNENNGIRTASPYTGKELYKLNISRKDITKDGYVYVGLPKDSGNSCYYFINLTSIERKTSAELYPESGTTSTYYYKGYISDFEEKKGRREVLDYILSDDIVNNYFHTSVTKFFYDFNIPVEQHIGKNVYTPDISNLIYHYEITPAMDYGLLREYAVEGYIDFSKIGTGAIDLTHWKYYNTENISTLTLGLDAYVEENKGIAEVALEFYDNQGYAATYHIRNRESYSGIFTEVIPLNGVILNSNLDSEPNPDGTKRYHVGPVAADFAENVGYLIQNDPTFHPLYYKQVDGEVKAYTDSGYTLEYTDKSNLVVNDSGIIYGNAIYLVKIIVKYCQKDVLGNLDTSLDSEFKTYYRWYWTNTAFNEHYSNVNDFNVLQPSLTVDVNVKYEMDNTKYKIELDSPSGNETDKQDLLKSAGVIIQKMENQPIRVYASPYLYNNYNTFTLLGNKSDGTGVYEGLNLKICKAKRYIENYLANGSKEPPIQIHTGEYSASSYTEWEGMKFVPGDTESTNQMLQYYANWRDPVQEGVDGGGGYETLTDDFRVEFTAGATDYDRHGEPAGIYIGKDSTYIKKDNYPEKTYTCNDIDNGKEIFNLNLQHYSKYYTISSYVSKDATGLSPLIKTVDDLDKYNIAIGDYNQPYIKTHVSVLVSGQGHESLNVRFWNGNTIGDVGEWEFWFDHDIDYLMTIDVWGVGGDYTKFFKGCYIDAWTGIWTQQLSQFNHDNSLVFWHRQNGGQDEEGGITNVWCRGKNTNLTDGDGCLMKPGFFTYNFYESKPGSAFDENRIYHGWIGFSNNQGITIDTNPTPDITIDWNTYGIGFVDRDHNMHFFNTRDWVDLLFSILAQLYILDKNATLPVLISTDTVYLEDNYTKYTLDIVYEYYSNGSVADNDLITLHGIDYIDYISTILDKVGESNYMNTGASNLIERKKFIDTNNVSMNNVNISLKYSSRNVPLEFKMDYRKPDTFKNLEDDLSKTVLYTLNGDSGIVVDALDPINNTTLYYYDKDQNAVKEIDGGLQVQYCSINEVKADQIIILTSNNHTISAPLFNTVFKFSGEYLEFVNKEYSPSKSYWSVGLTYKGFTGTLCDLIKTDILLGNNSNIVPLFSF